MNNANLSFVQANAQGQKYTLTCTNNSSAPWVFYVYQKMPNQPSEVFSLAWFASPFTLAPGAYIKFDWTIDYSFVWGRSGIVTPGVNYNGGGSVPCSPSGDNQTIFSVANNTPTLSPALPGGQAGSLTINQASNVPNLTYSTGIGMSGQGTFVQQALQNTTQVYTPEPMYWIAAATSMQMGVVLAQTVSQTAPVNFPTNVYDLYASLGQDNQWTVSNTP